MIGISLKNPLAKYRLVSRRALPRDKHIVIKKNLVITINIIIIIVITV